MPITAAKALVESVANTRGNSRSDTQEEAKVAAQESVETSERRADHGDFKYIDHHQRRPQHQRPHHFRPVQHHLNNNRRQDASKSFRFNQQLNTINVDGNRRNTKKLPPPSPTHFNHVGQNARPKPQPQQQSAFSFVPSFNSLSAFNPLNYFFDTREPVTTPRSVSGPAQETNNINAIKTIAAPDLSKYGPGPPVIELDSGADGEIILGRPFHAGGHAHDRDHLAGFVSLDFDGFTSGDQAKKPKRQQKQDKEKLSIIVGGAKAVTKPRDQADLVNFLNNDRDNTDTFVFSSDKSPPQGFAKIDLPFMDPTKHHGELPKAFIAPKGIPIPDGYKGKPLPHQPHEQSTTEKVLIHQTNKFDRDESLFRPRPSLVSRLPEERTTKEPVPTTTEKTSLLTSQLRFKNRNRPSLTEFIRKNKEKVALLSDEKTDTAESNEKPGYFNDKIQETRKEFKESYSPSDVIIPVENNFNTFKLVTDNDAAPQEIVDVFSAGDDDNDPISLVFDPVLTHSTLEQAEDDTEEVATTEKESEEPVTSFAPTVPTTVADIAQDTTTPAATETSASSTTTATSTSTTPSTTSYKFTTQDPFARLETLRKQKFKKISTSAPSYQGDLVSGEDISPSTESPTFNFASPFRNRFRPFKKFDNLPEDFGRRTRKKKKTGVWVKKYSFKGGEGLSGGSSIEPTRRPYVPRARLSSYSSTTTETAKVDDYKQKYRPIFEGLYSQLTTEKTETTEKEENRRFGLPIRGRRTTTPSAYTVGKMIEIIKDTFIYCPCRC